MNLPDISKYKSGKGEEWKELGKELTAHFKKNCFWIPWKYEVWKIREAFKERDKGFEYFMGVLRNIK
jgi:hypothetical protein